MVGRGVKVKVGVIVLVGVLVNVGSVPVGVLVMVGVLVGVVVGAQMPLAGVSPSNSRSPSQHLAQPNSLMWYQEYAKGMLVSRNVSMRLYSPSGKVSYPK